MKVTLCLNISYEGIKLVDNIVGFSGWKEMILPDMRGNKLTLSAHCRSAELQDDRQMQKPGWVQYMQSVGWEKIVF